MLSRRDADAIRVQLVDGIEAATQYIPAIECGAISFLPVQSVRRLSWEAQDEVRDLEFIHDVRQQILDAADDDSFEGVESPAPPSSELILQAEQRADRIRDLPEAQIRDRRALRRLHDVAEKHPDSALFDFFLSHAWLADRLGMHPVVGSSQGFRGEPRTDVPSIHAGVADLIASFTLPGPDSLSLKEIVNLRTNEEAFSEFRGTYAQTLAQVIEGAPSRQEEFDLEFAGAIRESLSAHQRKIIAARRASPTLDQWLPVPFTFSAVAIEHAITNAFPTGSLLTTVAATLALVLATAIQHRESPADRVQRIALTSLIVMTVALVLAQRGLDA